MTLREILVDAVLALGIFAGVVVAIDSCHRKEGQAQAVQVAVHEGAANAHQAQAKEIDSRVPVLEKELSVQKASVAKLRSELAALKDSPKESHKCPDNTAIIAKQDELITAQDGQIKTLTKEVVVLTQARNAWKKTAEEREQQALAQAAATEAWKKAVTSSLWKGRVQGFAAGVVLGYVGAKR